MRRGYGKIIMEVVKGECEKRVWKDMEVVKGECEKRV